MKNFILFGLILAAIQTTSCATYSQAYSDQYYQDNNSQYQDNSNQNEEDISYQTFYDDLSPYGQWINNPEYGYVWSPNVGDDFKPYATNGHWVYTDLGWTWVSGYDWGWATFHYGRWFYDNVYGWLWLPGYEWAPAWVSWRNCDDYYGWAPLGPSVNFNISIGTYNPPINYWCFAYHQYITRPDIYNYCVNENRNVTIINRTTIINNTVINNYNNRSNNRFFAAGPRASEVEQFTHSSIRPVIVRDNNRAGVVQTNNEIRMFRPRVNANTTTQKFIPAHVQSIKNFSQPVNNSNANSQENRPVFFNKPDNAGINNQPSAPAIPNKPFMNDNRSFQRPALAQTQPVVNDSRQSHELPFFRNNGFNANNHVQIPVKPQRTMNMQPQSRPVQQFQNTNSFGNRKSFDRKGR